MQFVFIVPKTKPVRQYKNRIGIPIRANFCKAESDKDSKEECGQRISRKKGETMCHHQWVKIHDVCVCKNCGLTRTYDGKVLFDRGVMGSITKRQKRVRRK
nr:MAG TPA: hypothetical protein [Caudoviricetes sp.]